MGSTFTSLYYHVIFSTKLRAPMIDTTWQPRLHHYLAGAVNGLGGKAEAVGGMPDHIHLLFFLRPTHRLSDFMRDLKTNTSKWVSEEMACADFAWQNGYGAFTVSASARQNVVSYIANQPEHHRHKSFKEELIEFLDRAGVEYDPQYLD